MEYPFKLSEIIAGCENSAWIEGALFASECNCVLEVLNNTVEIHGFVKLDSNWRFVKYVD